MNGIGRSSIPVVNPDHMRQSAPAIAAEPVTESETTTHDINCLLQKPVSLTLEIAQYLSPSEIPLLAARCTSRHTHRSVPYGRKTTALTWKLESSAWHLTRYLARFWDANYYRTYYESHDEPAGYWGVEQEIERALASGSDFVDAPKGSANFVLKTRGLVRDRIDDARPAWVVCDGSYVPASWPGNVHTFARRLVEVISAQNRNMTQRVTD